MVILPFRAVYFMVQKGYIYTIAACFYAFRLVFSTIFHRILPHLGLHLAAKRKAFSTKMQCVLRHIALHLAANSPKIGANGGLLK